MTNSPKQNYFNPVGVLTLGKSLSLLAFLFVGSFALAETYTDDTVPSAPSNINTNTEFAITNSATYTGTITGGTITKTGAGTLTLTNSITAATITSNAGTLVLGTSGDSINIGSDATIKTNGGDVQVDGKIVVDSGKLFVTGTWTGDGKISVNSNGQFRISGSYTYPTGITLNGGLLMNAANGALTVSSPITIETASNVQAGYGKNSGNLILAGGLNGSGALNVNTENNLGWVSVTGTGDYSGSLTLQGKIRIGGEGKNIGTSAAPADASPYIGSKEIQFRGGTLHNYDAYLTFSNDLNFVSNSNLQAGWSKDMTFTGNIKGSGAVVVPSDGGWVIMKTSSSGNSFTGNVQLNWDKTSSLGKMRLGSDQPFGANVGQANIYGQLDMNGYSQIFKGLVSDTGKDGKTTVYKGSIFNNASSSVSTLTLDITGKNLTYYGTISGKIELVVNSDGNGTQSFTNNGSNFTGNVTINGGTLKATVAHNNYNTTALGKFSIDGGRTITVNSGAELALGTNDVLGGCTLSYFNANSMRLILNGGKLSGQNNNPLYNATFQNGAEVYGNNNRDVYRSFWLMGTNTVSCAEDGETPEKPVQFNGASGVIFVLDSAVLNVADVTRSDASDLVVNVILGNKSKDFVTNNSLTKTGSGTVEFTKANAYTGGTTISKGVLKFTDAAVVANGPITVGADGTLEYNLSSGQTKKLTITNASKIFSTGKVVKTGDGTLQICTESAGLVDASSFVVSSGRLDMKEYFKGSLTVESGATMSPGNSIGKLTVDGDFNLNGGTLLMEVAGPTADDSDQLIVTNGSLIFGEGATILLDFVNGMSPNAEFAVVIDAPNSTDDWVKYVDASYLTGLSYTQTGPDGRWVLSGHIDANAVPEPSTWALLVLGVAALLLRKRVRN